MCVCVYINIYFNQNSILQWIECKSEYDNPLKWFSINSWVPVFRSPTDTISDKWGLWSYFWHIYSTKQRKQPFLTKLSYWDISSIALHIGKKKINCNCFLEVILILLTPTSNTYYSSVSVRMCLATYKTKISVKKFIFSYIK